MAEDGDYRRSSAPLLGAILCCTSIPPERRVKSELASKAEEMGAIHKLDLTSDVTHLIVGNWDTPKYKYVAKERPDVRIVKPEWIEALRESWINGDDVNVESLEETYIVPTFGDLKICLTGFDDEDDRRRLTEDINSHGGEWHADLTREVTHLIAAQATGTKFRYAQKWGIRVVTREWLNDSIERGMILDEGLYHPLIPTNERGQNAWIRRTASGTTLGKRSRDAKQGAEEAEKFGRRKLRRTASAKLTVQNSGIWTDIVGGGFAGNQASTNSWECDGLKDTNATGINAEAPKMEQSSRGNPVTYDEKDKENHYPLAKQSLVSNLATDSAARKYGLFSDRNFYLYGFDEKKTNILQTHLLSHDANISSSTTDLSQSDSTLPASEGYLVVPHTLRVKNHPSLPVSQIPLYTVSEWWLERCLHRKQVVDHRKEITSTPFNKYPVQGFENMIMCSTGFSGIDLLHTSKTVKLLGAAYDEFLSRNATVLICNGSASNQEKIRHATEWKIPSVSVDWLWDCVRSGERGSFSSFLVSAVPQPTSVSESSSATLEGDRLNLLLDNNPQPPIKAPQSHKNTKATRAKKTLLMQKRPPSPPMKDTMNSPDPEINVSPLDDNFPSFPPDEDVGTSSAVLQPSGTSPRAPNPTKISSPGHLSSSRKHSYEKNSPYKQDQRAASKPAEKPSLTAQLASLLSRQAAKPVSAAAPLSPSKRPIRRLLGRASSSSSSRALSNPNLDHKSRASSIDSEMSTNSLFILQEPVPKKAEAPEPSQKVLYEDAELMAKREKAGERMRNGKQKEKLNGDGDLAAVDLGKKSTGVVKDVGEVAGISGRTRRRGGKV